MLRGNIHETIIKHFKMFYQHEEAKNTKNGVVRFATSNAKLFQKTIWSVLNFILYKKYLRL